MAINLYESKWVSLKQTRYGFIYSERHGRDSVAILLTRNRGTEVLLRCQPLVADYTHNYGCPVTGSIDHDGEDIDACAIREVQEETGYIVSSLELLVKYVVGTQTNECCHLYTADVTQLIAGPDCNEEMHEVGENEWVPLETLLECKYAGTLIGYTFLKMRMEK